MNNNIIVIKGLKIYRLNPKVKFRLKDIKFNIKFKVNVLKPNSLSKKKRNEIKTYLKDTLDKYKKYVD